MRSLAAEVQAQDPSLSPAEAYQQAFSSPSEQALRGLERIQSEAIAEVEAEPQPETHDQRSARRELSRLVDQVQLQHPRTSASDAWTEVHRRNPDLYARAKGAEE